jgi:hypothetical protein
MKDIHQLKDVNGYVCVDARDVIVAGQDFMKNAQPPECKGYILGKLDRKVKDKRFSRFVVVKSGEHKGLKGKVCWADDNLVKVELMAKDLKIVIPRENVAEIKEPEKVIPFKNADLGFKSFDDAAKEDMGIFSMENMMTMRPGTVMPMMRAGNKIKLYIDIGFDPRRTTRVDDDVNDDDWN